MEDIKKENRQETATEETKAEMAVVTDSDTKEKVPEGAVVINLARPYTYEDKTYKKFVFDFEEIGRAHV